MMLEVKNLHFAYKKNEVIRGIDFSADKGECVFLLGGNGAGKTTLFRCILRLLSGYNGEILIDGKNAKRFSALELARKIAYIPQAQTPTFNYTVFETALMGTSPLRGMLHAPGRAEKEIALEALRQMNISHFAGRGVAELSGGERQLVLIARALAQQSPILVMDEPTANLDYGNQFRVMRRIRGLTEKGYLVLISSHNPEHAISYGDTVLALKDGRIYLRGCPSEILGKDAIEDIYGMKQFIEKEADTHGF